MSRSGFDKHKSEWAKLAEQAEQKRRAEARARNATLASRWGLRPDYGSEEAAQEAVIHWRDRKDVREELGEEIALLYHVPNGGHRHSRVAGKMKAAGVISGVPDLFLPVPRMAGTLHQPPPPHMRYGDAQFMSTPAFHGLWLELKYGRNDVEKDDNQYHMLTRLRALRYATDVVHSAAQAVALIEEYMTDPESFITGH